MNPNDFNGPLTFPPVPSADWHMMFSLRCAIIRLIYMTFLTNNYVRLGRSLNISSCTHSRSKLNLVKYFCLWVMTYLQNSRTYSITVVISLLFTYEHICFMMDWCDFKITKTLHVQYLLLDSFYHNNIGKLLHMSFIPERYNSQKGRDAVQYVNKKKW